MKNKMKILIMLSIITFASITTSAMQSDKPIKEIKETNLKNENNKTEENSKKFKKNQNANEDYIKACKYLRKENLSKEDIEKYVYDCYIVEPPMEKNPNAKEIYSEFIAKIYPDGGKKFLDELKNKLNSH